MGPVYLAAETLTLNQIVQMWEKQHGEKLQVRYVTDEFEERVKSLQTYRVRNYWTQWPDFIQVGYSIEP